jgi:fructokinase
MQKLFGAIEAGGTKCNCAVVDEAYSIVHELRIPTTTPAETLTAINGFFKAHRVSAIGVSSFGPLDLHPQSPSFGFITCTPKLAWRNTDILAPLREFQVPLAIDTDVNGAALGEHTCGAAQGLDTFVYFTIGTGIGGGGMCGGKLLHGLTHPEMGHIFIPHDTERDPFPGCCPAHGDCFEGLASGPALEKRWGRNPSLIPANDPAWQLQAHYVALAIVNTALTLSPQRVILGGGVMQNEFLFPMIRAGVQQLLNGYVQHAALLEAIDTFIVPPKLGNRSGVIGAAALARQALKH